MQLNNPFGDNYPFIGPPMDDPSIEKVVYDIYITYYVPDLQYKLPLKLVSISNGTVTLANSDNEIIFSLHMSYKIWGNSYYIYQGHTDGVSVSLITKGLVQDYTPDHGELCLRCVYTQPKHITSITVNDIKLNPNIDIDYGYNIEYSESRDTISPVRPAKLITIDANPGAGMGLVPVDCTSYVHNSIYSINGVTPDENGTIYINGDKGTKFVQVTDHGTHVSDDTKPCCLCADFSYLGTVLNKHIHSSYIVGATAEAARDSLKDLMELLSCGNIEIVLCKEFHPLRVYVDTTWPRHAIITAEFRNIMPVIVKGLTVHVNVSGGDCQDHTPLRSFVPTEVVPGRAPIDAQAGDNGSILSLNGNSWDINWASQELSPGMTLWASVRVRLGSMCKEPGGSISVVATSSFSVEPFGCVKEECLHNLNIVYTARGSGRIKSGYGWNDPSGKDDEDEPNDGGGEASLKCMLDRVYEICKEEEEARKAEAEGNSAK